MGRQPIYNKQYVLSAQELLDRDNVNKDRSQFLDEDRSLRHVFSEAIHSFGIQALTDGLPAHVSFTRDLILTNLPYMAKPDEIVVELAGNMLVDKQIEEKLNELKMAGYRLCLAGYNARNGILRFNRVMQLFDMVRLNARVMNRLQMRELVKKIRQNSRAALIAEQVDTEADFDRANGIDFSYYQGLLFGMPVCLREERDVGQLPYGQLFNELAKPNGNFESCVKLIENDPVLTHMFLQQSPKPGKNQDPGVEIRRILMTMGMERLRRWSCLTLLKRANLTNSYELPSRAYLRGCFIERLMEKADTRADAEQGLYLGIFSLLDKITDTPLESLLSQLRSDREVRAALLGSAENEYAAFLQYAIEYEKTRQAPQNSKIRLGLNERQIASLYGDSERETENAFAFLNPFMPPSFKR